MTTLPKTPDSRLERTLAKLGLDQPAAPDTPAVNRNVFRPPARSPLADRVISASDVPPPPEELPCLWGTYLEESGRHWLTGATGLGKSTFAFNLAGALAEGRELWGVPCSPTRVLYVDTESGDHGRRLKLARLYADAPRPRDLLFLPDAPHLPSETDALIAFAKSERLGLVILDTARRCFAIKDENDNAEFYQKVVPVLDGLRNVGTATLVLGHPAKAGDGSPRGAGGQADAVDVSLSLTANGENGVTLRVAKSRLFGLSVPPLYLRRIGNDQFECRDGDGPADVSETPTKLVACRDTIVRLLWGRNDPASHSEIIAAAREQGYTESTTKRALKALKEADTVGNDEGGYLLDPFIEDIKTALKGSGSIVP